MELEQAIEIVTNAVQSHDYTAEKDIALAIVQKAAEKQIWRRKAMAKKFYYRLVDETAEEVDIYVESNLPVKSVEKLSEVIGIEGYKAEEISEEEYRANIDDGSDEDEEL